MITREFKLYLNAGTNIAPVIDVNQFDQDEEWIFTLLQSDGTVYTPSTGAIIGLKQDGTTILNAGTVNSSGQVVITETEQMTAVPGSNLFEILIDGNSHGTANFVVFVERRPGDIDNPSESDISLFQEAIEAAGNVTQFQADISALQSGLATTNANLTSEANTRASADATLQTNLSAEASTRQTQDAVLQAEIDQIIAPTGEAPSAAEVQNARIGVDGTTYDTLGNAIRGQVGDLKNAVSNIYETETSDYTSAYTSGSIALNVGVGNTVTPTPSTSTNYLWQIIPCSKGDTFVIQGNGGDTPRLWGFTDIAYKLLSVAGPNATETSRTLTATEKGYFISNTNKNYTYSLSATLAKSKIDALEVDVDNLQNNIESIDSDILDIERNLMSDVVSYGDVIDLSNATFYKNSKCTGFGSDYSPIIVTDVSYLVSMPIPSDVERIWIKKFTNAGQMLMLYTVGTKGVNYVKSTNADNFLIYNGDDYIVLDCANSLSAGYTTMLLSFDDEKYSGIYEYKGIFTVKQNLDYVTPLTGLNMFDSIACLGDSYTQGFIVKSDTSATIAHKPYPTVLHDKLGITVDNYGVGGTTSKTYITHTQGLPRVLADNAHDLYIICFGINDQGQKMTIGNASDINDEDYTQNSDSFYGNMGKIIQMLKEQFPLARYVIIGNWATGLWYSAYNPYNVASKGIAEHFNIPYVNPMDDPFFYSDIFINDVGGHPTQVGYTGIAYAVERLMAKCIAENYAYYKYAGIEEA